MSDDEFDNIPDDFADVHGVDWGRILAVPATPHAQDTHPPVNAHTNANANTNANTNGNANAEASSSAQAHNVPASSPQPASNASSSSYFSDDDDGMDAGFLAELDRLEERLTQTQTQGQATAAVPPATHAAARAARSATGATAVMSSDRGGEAFAPRPPQSHRPSGARHGNGAADLSVATSDQKRKSDWKEGGEHVSSVPSKRLRVEDAAEMSPRSKGKMRADDDHLAQIFAGYDDELTCPICSDLFVAPHVGNPCGHTFCGDCGWQWYYHKTSQRCCPCCRTTLDRTTPMIVNISMNNTVEKHVKALAISGQKEWEPGGSKHKEWMSRKEAWQAGEKERARKKQPPVKIYSHGPALQITDVPDSWFYVPDDPEADPTYEDSDVEHVPPPPPPPRRRRRRRGGG